MNDASPMNVDAPVTLRVDENVLLPPVSVVRLSVPAVSALMVPLVEKRFVELAVVAKKLVEVALASVVSPVTPSVPATDRLPALSNVLVAVAPK